MGPTRDAPASPFVVLPSVHIDRDVLADLLAWAEPRGLTAEQAVQLAVCLFNERRVEWLRSTPELQQPSLVGPPRSVLPWADR